MSKELSVQHVRAVISNCTLLFQILLTPSYHLSAPPSLFFVCSVSLLWSRLAQRCMQAVNVLGVSQRLACFSAWISLCLLLEINLDGPTTWLQTSSHLSILQFSAVKMRCSMEIENVYTEVFFVCQLRVKLFEIGSQNWKTYIFFFSFLFFMLLVDQLRMRYYVDTMQDADLRCLKLYYWGSYRGSQALLPDDAENLTVDFANVRLFLGFKFSTWKV